VLGIGAKWHGLPGAGIAMVWLIRSLEGGGVCVQARTCPRNGGCILVNTNTYNMCVTFCKASTVHSIEKAEGDGLGPLQCRYTREIQLPCQELVACREPTGHGIRARWQAHVVQSSEACVQSTPKRRDRAVPAYPRLRSPSPMALSRLRFFPTFYGFRQRTPKKKKRNRHTRQRI
jgi:hypothetical protein